MGVVETALLHAAKKLHATTDALHPKKRICI
jgi:hypothetical protein